MDYRIRKEATSYQELVKMKLILNQIVCKLETALISPELDDKRLTVAIKEFRENSKEVLTNIAIREIFEIEDQPLVKKIEYLTNFFDTLKEEQNVEKLR